MVKKLIRIPIYIYRSLSHDIINMQDGIAIGRTFAAIRDYHIDGNKEMIAFGVMNIVGSCTSCYAATGKQIK